MSLSGTELRENRKRIGLSQARLAELSGISQHLLSAFELEKSNLPPSVSIALSRALADKEAVTSVVGRQKRYRKHVYGEIERIPERVAKTVRTKGNIEYCRVLEEITESHASTERTLSCFSAVSLFSGCGGLSLGFSAAGFQVKGFLELDEDLRSIYKSNFPQCVELGSDVTGISPERLFDISKKVGDVTAIVGGPPCQGFSLAGKRQEDDPRNRLFKHYVKFVDALRPKVAILENVRLLTSMKNPQGGLVKDEICAEFEKHGYRIRSFEVNAKEYGVPQHRERVIFVAFRQDLKIVPTVPEPTHSSGDHLFSPCYRTFADACSDLAFIESGQQSSDPLHAAVKHPMHVIKWLWDVPEGGTAQDNEPNNRPPSGYNTTYKRQVWNEPASAVQTTFGMISGCRNVHPIATRSLTIREAARIQSFPDSFVFVGTAGAIRTGIGNAVPPLLAYKLALHVKELLKSCKSSPPPD